VEEEVEMLRRRKRTSRILLVARHLTLQHHNM